MLNKAGESGQPFRIPLLIFIGCVDAAFSLISITFFSYIL